MYIDTVEAPVKQTSKRGDICRQAAYLIEEFGWVQGPDGTKWIDGPFCLAGAIAKAAFGHPFTNRYDNSIYLYISEKVEVPRCPDDPKLVYMKGYMWNDGRGRTKEEVVSLLYEVADEYDAKVE